MANTKKTEGQQIIKINPIKLQKARITLVGDTPLIVHSWSEKAKKEMLAAQTKQKKDKKAIVLSAQVLNGVSGLNSIQLLLYLSNVKR